MSDLKFYHWLNNGILGRYSAGDFIVVASSADEARDKIRGKLEDVIREHHHYEWEQAFQPYAGEDPDCEGYNNLIREFEQEIAEEPSIYPIDHVFALGGSE